MSKYTKEEGHVGCEEDDKCLFCFPIEIGVKIIAVLSILGAVFQCVLVVEALSNFILLVFIGASAFFGVVSGILYLKFLMGDDQENRDNLPKAVIANLIGGLIQQVGVYLAMSGYIGGGVDVPGQAAGIGGFIMAVVMNLLITFYFYKVMIKFAASL